MTVCETSEVFDFMGTAEDVREQSDALVADLILRATEQFKQYTGRSPELVDCTTNAAVFGEGMNAQIFGNELFLDGIYRDIYEITEVKEDGSALTEIVSSATQNKDYILDKGEGKIVRPWGAWLRIPGTIEIKGRFGLIELDGTDYVTRSDVKQIIIEIVAALSGLWRQTIITEGGALETTRLKISEATQRAMDGYVLRAI